MTDDTETSSTQQPPADATPGAADSISLQTRAAAIAKVLADMPRVAKPVVSGPKL